jgi:hypothetical protein
MDTCKVLQAVREYSARLMPIMNAPVAVPMLASNLLVDPVELNMG